jgi:hypothetical protein
MRKRFRNFCRRLAWHVFNVLCITRDTKLQNFQLQLLHILLPCNSYLNKCGLNEAELCMETTKNMLHLFWNCNIVHNILFAVKYFLKICVITLSFNARKITLGISKKYFENRNTVNYIWLISKYIQLM